MKKYNIHILIGIGAFFLCIILSFIWTRVERDDMDGVKIRSLVYHTFGYYNLNSDTASEPKTKTYNRRSKEYKSDRNKPQYVHSFLFQEQKPNYM